MDAEGSSTRDCSKKMDGNGVGENTALPPAISGREKSSEIQDTLNDVGSKEIVYLRGIRFIMLAAVIGIMVFTVSMEGNIAVTSIVAISRDLGGFEKASWIMSSYQLGFVAFIVISAKLSDIFGRKPITAGLLVLFVMFSAGCAAAQSMNQLIIVRAFQGLGGGGCYTLSSILIVDSAPPDKYGKYVALAGIAIAMGTVLGPIIGGAIVLSTTWRWIYLINLPIGALALFLILAGMPNGFPYRERERRQRSLNAIFKTIHQNLDVTGSVLVLGAVLSFTAGFMEADSRFPWKSAYVITLLSTAILLSVALLIWEHQISSTNRSIQPILPWRLFANRVMVGILLVMLFVGAPMAVTGFQLPQRFQLINGLSSFDAGLRLLPFGTMFSVGCMAATSVASRYKVPAIYLIILGALLQVISFALLGTLRPSAKIEASVYGYLIISGFGCGITFIMAYITVPFTADECDKAVGMAAANQFRTMGSAMGLAVATSIFNGYILSRLSDLGFSGTITDLIVAQQSVSVPIEEDTRSILSHAYNRQMLVLCGFSAAQIPAALLMWKRKQILTV